MSKIIETKRVIGFEEAYSISSDGIIYRGGVIASPSLWKGGYLMMTMQLNGKIKRKYVHRLVAEHFIPNLLNLPQVNHKDGDKSNNHVNNLEWCTAAHNERHKSKLEQCDVNYIKNSNKTGVELSHIFEVSAACISLIKNNKRWSN